MRAVLDGNALVAVEGLGAGGCGDDEMQACDEEKTGRH